MIQLDLNNVYYVGCMKYTVFVVKCKTNQGINLEKII